MYPELEGLEPALLWKHFDAIMRIPHCSKHEDAVRRYVVNFAEGLGLEHAQDAAGNVVVRKGGTPARENAPTVILQGHLDMVCEKNADTEHDFGTQGIVPDKRDNLLYAKGTTLGADNGIGVATALAILESNDLEHGPIEALFTVDEETGLTGAFELELGFLQGRMMINLDSEDLGVVTIGCAGGGDTSLKLVLDHDHLGHHCTEATIKVSGLKGGHSGVDIHEDRANAVKLLARVMWNVWDLNLSIMDIKGGDKHNAIPREAWARVGFTTGELEELKAAISEAETAFQLEYGAREPDLRVTLEVGSEVECKVVSVASSWRVVELLMALPHGVWKYSHDIEGLVESSTNLAAVRIEDGALVVLLSTRSSIAPALEALRGRIEAIGNMAGAGVDHANAYPGWQPDPESDLLGIAKAVHANLFGKSPVVEAIHAGLETGIIGEKFPGMDMISIGPTIKNPHSPDEYVDLTTVPPFWNWVLALLSRLSS
jgi:dipeptidase D